MATVDRGAAGRSATAGILSLTSEQRTHSLLSCSCDIMYYVNSKCVWIVCCKLRVAKQDDGEEGFVGLSLLPPNTIYGYTLRMHLHIKLLDK